MCLVAQQSPTRTCSHMREWILGQGAVSQVTEVGRTDMKVVGNLLIHPLRGFLAVVQRQTIL